MTSSLVGIEATVGMGGSNLGQANRRVPGRVSRPIRRGATGVVSLVDRWNDGDEG